MPPSLDKPGVRGGVSETCLFNEHSLCRVLGCGCDCHIKAAVPVPEEATGEQPEQDKREKACPTCGVKRPFRETFCRVDGARLTSLVCGLCGAGGDTGDAFCWKCGAPVGKGSPPVDPAGSSLQVPALSEAEEEPAVDYGQRVVRELQAELAASQPEGGDSGTQKVVDQPMGVQGSFRIVNRPSPNKVRTGNPAPVSGTGPEGVAKPVGPRPGFRLPVKPS